MDNIQEIDTNQTIEKTPDLKAEYKQIDGFTKKELELIDEMTNLSNGIPHDVVYNFYKFLKTLTKEQQKLYLEDSDKLWEQLNVKHIGNNYTIENIKIDDENHELIHFSSKEENDEYWKKRLEGISHETLTKEMNLNIKKNIKKTITDEDIQEINRIRDIYEDEVRVI